MNCQHEVMPDIAAQMRIETIQQPFVLISKEGDFPSHEVRVV
jgi:hypothetical protein